MVPTNIPIERHFCPTSLPGNRDEVGDSRRHYSNRREALGHDAKPRRGSTLFRNLKKGGIAFLLEDAAVRNVAVTSQHLQQVATQLERHGQSEIRLSADVELFLRISNSDVLSSIQCVPFRVRVDADTDNLRATASNEEGWGAAWERGIEPIRHFALQSMKEDISKMDATLAEDSYTFQAAMVLLASAVVGPYSVS